MPYGIYVSAEGAYAQSRRMEHLSNNLANVDTPGFKRDLATFQARYAEETQRGSDYPGSRSINDLSGGVQVKQSQTDFSPGTLRKTGFPTDMAVQGEGFFVVEKGGQKMLTRSGNFTQTATGQLTTQDGYPLLSEEGQPIIVDPEGGDWKLNSNGTIVQNGSTFSLGLMKPKSLGDLAKAGDNLFSPLAETENVPAEARSVLQGHLEMSGVRPTTEMMELIEASRAFEANTNMIRNQDQMLGNLIGRILKT